MMATASATTNELASNDKDGLPAPRRRAGGRRGMNNNLNSSFTTACSISNTEQNSDDTPKSESAAADDGAEPKRRTTIESRRQRGGSLGSNLSNSLNRSMTGIERTEGRLSVSFSDGRGLSASAIADILSGSGLEPDEESEKSAKEMMEDQEELAEGRDNLGSLGGAASPRSRRRLSRPKLQTIVSQRIMKFDSSDGSDED